MKIRVELWADECLGEFEMFVQDVRFVIDLHKQFIFEDKDGREYKFRDVFLGVGCVTIYLEKVE